MFYYTDQSNTLWFPIGLIKTESDFIVRSVETDLGRLMLVVAVLVVLMLIPFWLSQTWPVTLSVQE